MSQIEFGGFIACYAGFEDGYYRIESGKEKTVPRGIVESEEGLGYLYKIMSAYQSSPTHHPTVFSHIRAPTILSNRKITAT